MHRAVDDGGALRPVGQRHLQPRGEVLELGREGHLMAEQDEGAGDAAVVLADVLEEPHRDRVLEERVQVQQHVDAGERARPDVAQDLHRLGVEPLPGAGRAGVGREAVRDRPAQDRQVRGTRGGGDGLERARLVTGLHHDERHAAGQERLEVLRGSQRRHGVRLAITDPVGADSATSGRRGGARRR